MSYNRLCERSRKGGAMSNDETVLAWTRQVPEVWDEIQKTGRYMVKEEYVRTKNGDISDYYLAMYRWLSHGCQSRVADFPEGADLPIWLALTENQRLGAVENAISLTLEVPRSSLFVLDYDRWGYRLNNWYVPTDAEDERRHNEELERMGIGNEAALIDSQKGNFYPALKTKIIRSWDRVFEHPNPDMNLNVGIIWEIRPEWVKEVEFYD